MSDKKFIDGFWANKPHENAPDFIKTGISIDLARFFEWAKQWKKDSPDEKYLKITVKESQKGDFYAEEDTWKPKEKTQPASPHSDDGFSDDIPF